MSKQLFRLATCNAAVTATMVISCPTHAEGLVDQLIGDKTEVSVGAAAYIGPRYLGASNYRAALLPVVSVERGIFFADVASGIGLQYQHGGFYVSQSFNYDLGRKEENDSYVPGSPRLRGMGEVASSATWHTWLAQRLTETVSVSAEADVTLRHATDRQYGRLGLEWTAYKRTGDELTLKVDTHWGNAKYNQAYFGVTDAQAASTGLRAYKIGSGLYAYSIGARWEHQWSPHWSTLALVSVMPYVDKVSSSPLVGRTSIESTVVTRYAF